MDENTFKTSDLSLAAFLTMKGMVLSRCNKNATGKFEFIFEDPDEKAPGLSMNYLNSEFCKFDNHVRTLKKMLYKN
jgi:hypothetical protein